MYDFTYRHASSVSEATGNWRSAADAVYLAGGMTLIPSLKLRLANPDLVIDLAGIDELTGIEDSGSEIHVGALTTHTEVANGASLGALASLAAGIGDLQVRNRGTIGGSLANNDPAADYPAAVLGLNATVHTSKRAVSADDFFIGLFETALEPGELISKVSFRKPKRAAYEKFHQPASRFALVGVMVAEFDSSVRVAVTGAGPCVFRHTGVEDALNANLDPAAVDDVVIDSTNLNEDLHGSAEYRANLISVLTRRAVANL